MDQQNLAALLDSLRSANNEERKAAEEQYNNVVAANPVWAMHAMAEISATAQDAGVTAMSLVLLRKVLNQTPSPYATADADSRAAVKGRMLEVLNNAAYGHLRGSAAACVSALAVQVFQNKEDWSELWDNVFTIIGTQGSDVHLKTMCCEIVLATSLPMSAYFQAHSTSLAAGLETCFAAEAQSVDLKKAAFETTIRLSSLGMADCLRPQVPKMLGVIENYLNLGEWESVESLLEATVDGITSNIGLFQHDAQHLLELMMQVAAAPQVDSGARHMAVELMLTYCEEVPKTVRKVPQFATSFFELLFQYTLNPEYNKEWDTTGRDNDEDELEGDSDLIIGSSGLDRISNALGGRKLQKTAQELFANNINAPEWQRRNAAVLLICYAGEGMRTVFAQQLPSLVQMVVPHVKDESKYVRANTLDCIAQLSQDFTPELQMKLHAGILPAVVAALRDDVPRVASCAANCLDSFIDSVSGDEEEEDDDGLDEFRAILQPYIEPMCGDCVSMLSSTQYMFVREAALGVLSSVSSTCKSMLLPYVQSLVPIYQHVLSLPDSPEVMKTKCKAIECVTLLACGVGRDAFAAYSADVCSYLSNLCRGGLANDDPRTRFVMRGWTCMVECLKDQAQPYLGTVIPILLNMMSMECDMEIANIGVGDDDAEDGDQPDGVEKMRFVIPGVGERVVTIHTSLIEDKELASNVVFAMLKDLGVGLAPYFRDIANAGIGQLAFVVSDSIRESGASIIDEILKCYEEMRDPAAQQLAEAAMPKLMDALGDESENSVMEVMLQSIGRCVGVHPAIMSPTNTALVCDKVMAALEVLVKRRDECLEKKAAENDEDELDELEVEDEEVQVTITSVCDLIGTLLMASKEVFAAPFLVKAFPVIGKWLQAPSDEFYMTRATSLLSDFVANAPQSIVPSLPAICESALKIATATSDDALLQSDFFLMNTVVQLLGAHPEANMGVNGAEFAVHVQQTVAPYWSSNLVQDEMFTHTTCNALSLYVSLLDFYGTTALQQVAAAMLTTVGAALPAKDDEIEARRVHDVVLRWVTNNHPVLQAVPKSANGIVDRVKTADADCLSDAAKHFISTL